MRYLRFAIAIALQLLAGVVLLLIMPPLERVGVVGPAINNCWWYAFTLYRQRGGYLVMMPSEYGWWGHFRHSVDGVIWTEWTTDAKVRRCCPPLIFRGYVRTWTM